ncbi:dihydrofolate reductase family protein [Synechococcus sp. CS-1324]|nr:dihydrofolate reductase family protein [Synechococcus sp. CS-1326]MCT0230455.1 dihydrofolate reductase family protein [Synechococcus sp. CS-1324]MCT0233387.1 dihydrofolate reductase family protein [Synechococcus sp. CS-1327]PZV03342.1 MAG: riboflavin biosynthesis protein RibD [Cyanobium sp.]
MRPKSSLKRLCSTCGRLPSRPSPLSEPVAPARPLLRLVLAVSLDGRLAPPAGGAAQLGGRGDRRVLEESLAWADGCLIGARSLRLHRSTCLIHRPQLLQERRQAGRSPQPIALVASRSAAFEASLPFFSQPLERWLLQGGTGVPAHRPGLEPLPPGFDRQLPVESWSSALPELRRLGLERLVLLGGAQLAAGLLQGHWVDEIQLTLCPVLLGGPHGWCPATALPWGQSWELVEHRSLGESELLLRYRRAALIPAEGRNVASAPASAPP